LIDYRSYAKFAMQLSDQGIVVIVQNTEPFRFVAWIFGSNHAFCLETMQQVQERYPHLQVQEWSVGGHSMGGYTCYNLVKQLPGVFKKMVFYGVYTPMRCSKSLQNAGVDVLAVTASCDGFGFHDNIVAKRAFFDALPPLASSSASISTLSSTVQNESSPFIASATSSTEISSASIGATPYSNGTRSYTTNNTNATMNRTIHYDIMGGNHAGFADYLIQTFPKMDGQRTISLEEQHTQMTNVTCQFLLNKS
jgi:pimeloyl-ACP methyl ester carboxylesterase